MPTKSLEDALWTAAWRVVTSADYAGPVDDLSYIHGSIRLPYGKSTLNATLGRESWKGKGKLAEILGALVERSRCGGSPEFIRVSESNPRVSPLTRFSTVRSAFFGVRRGPRDRHEPGRPRLSWSHSDRP